MRSHAVAILLTIVALVAIGLGTYAGGGGEPAARSCCSAPEPHQVRVCQCGKLEGQECCCATLRARGEQIACGAACRCGWLANTEAPPEPVREPLVAVPVRMARLPGVVFEDFVDAFAAGRYESPAAGVEPPPPRC